MPELPSSILPSRFTPCSSIFCTSDEVSPEMAVVRYVTFCSSLRVNVMRPELWSSVATFTLSSSTIVLSSVYETSFTVARWMLGYTTEFSATMAAIAMIAYMIIDCRFFLLSMPFPCVGYQCLQQVLERRYPSCWDYVRPLCVYAVFPRSGSSPDRYASRSAVSSSICSRMWAPVSVSATM